jgi:hypothetical protein
MRKRIHAGENDRGHDGDHAEETYQARHRGRVPIRPLSVFAAPLCRRRTRRLESKAYKQIHYRAAIGASDFLDGGASWWRRAGLATIMVRGRFSQPAGAAGCADIEGGRIAVRRQTGPERRSGPQLRPSEFDLNA